MTLPVVWDMETQDPDDFLTLLLLLGHPGVRLVGVTITPGSAWQVGLVRRALSWFGADVPVGAGRLDHPKRCVSSWHYRAFGEAAPSTDAEPAGPLLAALCDEDTTLITGAPLKNLGAAMGQTGFRVGRWVAQGGFAGEGVIPPAEQLPKFRGLRECPTFNLGGDPRSALRALAHPGIGERWFVSKNVCHGVIWDEAFHRRVAGVKAGAPHLERIWVGMEAFLDRKRRPNARVGEAIDAPDVRLITRAGVDRGVVPRAEALAAAAAAGLALVEVNAAAAPPVCRLQPAPQRATWGKKLHDPLAACCAIDPSVGRWAEVELYRRRGRWGSRPRPGGDRIIVGYDPERFFQVLCAR